MTVPSKREFWEAHVSNVVRSFPGVWLSPETVTLHILDLNGSAPPLAMTKRILCDLDLTMPGKPFDRTWFHGACVKGKV